MGRFAAGTITITVALALVTVTLSAASSVAESVPPAGPRVTLTKTVDNAWPQVGEIVTFSVWFTNADNQIRLPARVRVTDANPAPQYLDILTPTITGDAWYSPTIDAVVWEDMLFWGDDAQVTFQVQIVGLPQPAPAFGYAITNTAILIDPTDFGSLPEQTAEATLIVGAPRTFFPVCIKEED